MNCPFIHFITFVWIPNILSYVNDDRDSNRNVLVKE